MVNKMTQKSNRDNRSRQKNPNNDAQRIGGQIKDKISEIEASIEGIKLGEMAQEKVWNVKLNLTKKPEMTENKI